MTVVSVIMLATYRVLGSGLACRERIDGELGDLYEARRFLTNIGSELRGAVLLATEDELPAFDLREGRISFLCSAPLSDRTVRAASALTRVTYQTNGDDAATVTRTRQFCAGRRAISESASADVLSGVEGLDFRCLARGSATWQSDWSAADELPAAVRIDLALMPDPDSKRWARPVRLSTIVAIGVRAPLQ